MYERRRYQRRSAGITSYLMPFLILVLLGVIVVLIFNLVKAIFSDNDAQGAYLHIVEGTVDLKPWGTEEFFELKSDVTVFAGDEFITSANGRVIVEFFDGTVMRVDGGSDVVIKEFDTDVQEPVLDLLLINGQVWFNKIYKGTETTEVNVAMSNVVVNSTGADVFAIENNFDEVVRGRTGEVMVDILDAAGEKVLETESIGVGQEIVFSDAVLNRYRQFQSPSVLSGIGDDFKASDWYEWNLEEDRNPTEFVRLEGGSSEFTVVEPEMTELPEDEEEAEEESEDEDVTEDPVEEEDPQDEEPSSLGTLTKPVIVSVEGVTEVNAEGFYVVDGGYLATLTGSVSGAEDIVVNGYTLQQFSAGDTSWNYFANAANPNLLRSGENTYEIYAVGENGERSESIFVKVLYNPPGGEEAVAEPEPEAAPEESAEASE